MCEECEAKEARRRQLCKPEICKQEGICQIWKHDRDCTPKIVLPPRDALDDQLMELRKQFPVTLEDCKLRAMAPAVVSS